MLELMIAPNDNTDFTFDARTLTAAATAQWPGAHVVEPWGGRVEVTDAIIYFPNPESPDEETEMAVIKGGALSIDTPSHEAAARVMAWIAQVCDLPTDGSVVVVHWTSDFYPLLPAVTVETLMRDVER